MHTILFEPTVTHLTSRKGPSLLVRRSFSVSPGPCQTYPQTAVLSLYLPVQLLREATSSVCILQ